MDMMISGKITILNSCPNSERSAARCGASPPPSEKIYAFFACMAVNVLNSLSHGGLRCTQPYSHSLSTPVCREQPGTCSIEQVLPPPVVAAAEHAHDLAAGVQRESPGFAQQDHVIDFVQQPVAFAAVARV